MFDFLRMLFFGTTIQLTAAPILMDEEVVIAFDEPVSAITSSPALMVRVVNPDTPKDLFEAVELFRKEFSGLRVEAVMFGASNDCKSTYHFNNGLHFDGQIKMVLDPVGKVEQDCPFDRVKIKSNMSVGMVEVWWSNSGPP